MMRMEAMRFGEAVQVLVQGIVGQEEGVQVWSVSVHPRPTAHHLISMISPLDVRHLQLAVFDQH